MEWWIFCAIQSTKYMLLNNVPLKPIVSSFFYHGPTRSNHNFNKLLTFPNRI